MNNLDLSNAIQPFIAQVDRITEAINGRNDYHCVLFWLYTLPSIILGGYILRQYILALQNQPNINKADIAYQEYFASGSSQKNLLTKLGGANNCLRLVVTKELLWVTSWFPFSLFASAYDLEHVIPLRSIASIESKQRFGATYLLVSYTDTQGRSQALTLKPKNQTVFLEALRLDSQHNDQIPVINVISTQEPTFTLKQVIEQYWHRYIGILLFPTVAFLSDKFLHIPAIFFAPIFFGVFIYSQWPGFTQRFPPRFRFLAFAAWIAGIFLAILAMTLVALLRSTFMGKQG